MIPRRTVAILTVITALATGIASPAADPDDFLRTRNGQIVGRENKPVILRGAVLELFEEDDLKTLSDEGANAVRLLLDARFFEKDPDALRKIGAFAGRAERHSLWVVLSFRSWPGVPDDSEEDAASWADQKNLDRLAGLWSEIAKAFRDNPTIAAYDLMHEPEPPSASAYATFIQYAVDLIRKQDPNHLILVQGTRSGDGLFEFGSAVAPIHDPNLAYGFTEAEPVRFTRQGSTLDDRRLGVGVSWPGRKIEEVRIAGHGGVRVTSGTHGRKRLKLEAVAPRGSEWLLPRLFVRGSGRARFEQIVVEDIDVFGGKSGDQIIFADTFPDAGSDYTPVGWWSEPWNAKISRIRGSGWENGTLVVVGNGRYVTTQPFQGHDFRRLPKAAESRRYRMTAEVEAENADEAGIAIDFLGTQKTSADSAEIFARFGEIDAWRAAVGAPVVLTDFWVTPHAVERGGRDWIRAVSEAAESKRYSWFSRVVVDEDGRRHAAKLDVLRVLLARKGSDRPSSRRPLPRPAPAADREVRQSWDQEKSPGRPAAATTAAPPVTPPLRVRGADVTAQTANPVPPPPTGCWFGAHGPEFPGDVFSGTSFSSVMRFMRRVDKQPAWVQIYAAWTDPDGGWARFPDEELREIVSTGAAPLVSWEPFISPRKTVRQTSLPFILDGHADTYIRSWATAARRFGRPFLIRLPAGTNPGLDVYHRVVGTFQDLGVTNVSWVWSPSDAPLTDIDALKSAKRPRADAVDWVGLSLYGIPEEGIEEVPFSTQQLKEAVDLFSDYGKPICLTEVACAAVEKQSAWWSEALQEIRSLDWLQIRAIILTETPRHWRASPLDLRLRGDAAHTIGLHLADPFFLGADRR